MIYMMFMFCNYKFSGFLHAGSIANTETFFLNHYHTCSLLGVSHMREAIESAMSFRIIQYCIRLSMRSEVKHTT